MPARDRKPLLLDPLDREKRQAEITKTLAEAEKLRREAITAERQARALAWGEPLKVLGALILGAGGAIAAYTQFEVAELKAKSANQEVKLAQEARGVAEAARKIAVDDKTQAEARSTKAKADSLAAEGAKMVAETAVEKASKQLAVATSSLALAKQSLQRAESQAGEAVARRDTALADAKVLEQRNLALRQDLERSQAQTTIARSELQKQALAGLRPAALVLAQKLIEQSKERGIDVRVVSGYRSAEQQEDLFKKGLTRVRRSPHNVGLAFDVGIFKGGIFQAAGPDYDTVGNIGKSLGLIWGGDWEPISDEPHFETSDAKEVVKQTALR